MAQIKVIAAVTTNGRDPLMRGGQQVFKETIVEASAQSIFEKMNRYKPEHLKFKFAPVDGIEVQKKIKTKSNDTE